MARLGWAAGIALALVLLRPLLAMVHVEGFTASMAALGLHMADGSRDAFFPAQPLNADFFTLTKLGVVGGIAVLTKTCGIGADTAFGLLMWAGFLPLLASSAVLARRWSGASWGVIGAVLLLMPGVAESAFFFNDNVPGCGLVLTGLALWTPRAPLARMVAAGVLIGLGTAVRTDLVLVACTVPLIAFATMPMRAAVRATALVAVPALAAVFAAYAAIGTTPFAALDAARTGVALWDRAPDAILQVIVILLFAGLPALVLFGVGTATLAAKRRWLTLALALGVPLFVDLVLYGKLWQPRQLLVLTPFLATLAAAGAEALRDRWRAGQRVVPVLFSALTVAALFGPPVPLTHKDGPHTLFGRVPALAYWDEWQRGVQQDFTTIDRAIATVAPGTRQVVLADGWDDDRYLHLRLWENGFRPIAGTSACRPVAQTMSDGRRTIVHISLQQSFYASWSALQAERFERLAQPCFASVGTADTVLLARARHMGRILAAANTPATLRLRADWHLVNVGSTRIVGIPLTPDAYPALAAAYRAGVEVTPGMTVPGMTDAIAATSQRIAR